jgi:hypothetical protein
MSKPVEVIQISPDEWTVAIRENSHTRENRVVVHIRGAEYQHNHKCFVPKKGRRTFTCGNGEFTSDIEKFTIVGRDISKPTTILFDCTNIQIKHPRYHRDASPERILHHMQSIQKHGHEFPWTEKKA